MLEDVTGRLVAGALWGLGAGLLMAVTRDGSGGLRSVAKGVVKGYLTIADRVQDTTAEMRENIGDLAAEVRAERAAATEGELDEAAPQVCDERRSRRVTSGQATGGKGPTRLILYVGKGGVGKTTLAAGTAALAARRGQRTLVVSTDLAHSLGDVLDVPLSAEPRTIADRLEAQEVNVLEEVRRSWGKVDRLAEVLREEGMSEVQADELAIVPGMEEVAGLMQIDRKVRSGEYDCIVVDAAPTGETIRLLSMPESFQWYAGRLDQWRGRLMRLAGPFLTTMVPDLNVVDVMKQVATRVRALRGRLTDPRQSSYRIVVTPDRTVLREAQRAETYLNLFNYPIDAVVVNRVLPPAERAIPSPRLCLLASSGH